jgi:hypothetical protein
MASDDKLRAQFSPSEADEPEQLAELSTSQTSKNLRISANG